MKKIGLLLVAFVITCIVKGQQFGGNPPSLHWKQINTDAVRVIFPAGLDSVAGGVASIATQIDKNAVYSIGKKRKKINIVLQNQTTISNGYVGLGPFRSEFYLMPDQNSFEIGSLPWHEQLAIHEYRHVQQYSNFNVGLSKAFRIVFGEEGQALANSLSVPNWFFEGDAVFNETRVSQQGRGRLPYFFNGYRSLWAADKNYSWMKLRNGSLRDYTPDHYPLGYMLVAYGYEKYGEDFWKKVTQDAAAFKGLFYPLQNAIKKYSGKDFRSFRQDALNYFSQQFAVEDKKSVVNKRMVTDEEYSAYINDSTVVFVKTSYNKIPAFVIRTGTSEKKLRVKDISLDNYFSYRNNKIVYAAYQSDIRWGYKDYNVLRMLDVTTGRQYTITRRSKYFSPDVNEAGDQIVAVQIDPSGRNNLHIIDAVNGKLLKELPDSGNLFYTYPKFYNEKKIIAAVRNKRGEMSLVLIDIADNHVDYLIPFSHAVIAFPAIQHDTVYFSASASKADCLFALSIKDRNLLQLTLPASIAAIGSYEPAVANNFISFSGFTAAGYTLQEVPKVFVKVDNSSLSDTSVFSIAALEKDTMDLLRKLNTSAYTSSIYPKSFHLFNFHSLEPYFIDPDYRFSLAGQNILNTLQSELFFNYNRDERYKQFGYNAVYGAWFPYISLGTSYTIDRNGFTNSNQHIYWNEAQVSGGLAVPLNLSKGRNRTYLTAGSNYFFNNLSYTGAFKSLGSFSFGYLSSSLSFSSQIQQARQHIYPRLAQSLLIRYNNAVYNIKAHQLLVSGSLYFPGLFLNHNLVLNGAYQMRDTLGQYSFSNSFPFSRGYEAPSLRTMYKWGVNYHLPLLYPDAGIANIVYLLRVRANLFYDNTVGKVAYTNGLRINTDFRSTGTELFFDTKWWNELPVSFGFRYSYLLDRDLFGRTGANRFEFILPVNLFQR